MHVSSILTASGARLNFFSVSPPINSSLSNFLERLQDVHSESLVNRLKWIDIMLRVVGPSNLGLSPVSWPLVRMCPGSLGWSVEFGNGSGF